MNANQEIGRAPTEGTLDTVKLMLATVAAAGGIVAFYWYAALPVWQRTLMVAAGAVIAVALAFATRPGRELWGFVDGSRIELRKMVWPTRQEAVQTTLLLVVFVAILGVVMLLIDMGLNLAIQSLLGRA